jgi:hypothetical protein
MWFRNEYRAKIIEPGMIVEFVPSDENGNTRPGRVVRVHDAGAAKIAEGWAPSDRVFLFHELESDRIDCGYFNPRTQERISL